MALQDYSLIIGGPAIVTHNGATYYTDGNIDVKVTKTLKSRRVEGFGDIPEKIIDVKVEITFKPVEYKNLSLMIPYLGLAMGTPIFGSTDKPVVIQSMTEGNKYTWSRGAVTKAPVLGLGVKKDLLGTMTITALKANATALSGAGSVVAIATNAFADTSFDVTKAIDRNYTIAWGASPFDAIESEDGVIVTPEYEFDPIMQSGQLGEMRLKNVKCKASFTPTNLTHANLLTLADLQAKASGTPLAPTGANNLVITGPTTGDPLVTLIKAYVGDVGYRAGVKDHYANTFNFIAARTFSSGAAAAIASFSVV